MRMTRRIDVVGVLAGAGEETVILLASNRLPDAIEIARAHTLSPHGSGALRHRLDDVLVTRATTKVAFELGPDRLLVGIRMPMYQIDRAQNHARGAESALQAVAFLERRLHRMHRAIGCEALDGHNLRALRLHGEDGAGLDRVAVDEHGACTALSGVATHVRAGQREVIADKVDEQGARIDILAFRLAIDGE